jgi:UbiD family decarboxylase
MPEFPGYVGAAQSHQPLLRVTGITHRVDPIFQTLIGPGEEHVTLAGLPTEASIFRLVEDAMPGFLKNVYLASPGGGKYLAVMQVSKRTSEDGGRPRQAALTALTAFYELKHVILVDDDVDPYDMGDVMWAMTTRYQGDVSQVLIPGVRGHALDVSATPEYNPLLRDSGIGCKTIFDCTVPMHMKDKFERSPFVDVDLNKYFPEKR